MHNKLLFLLILLLFYGCYYNSEEELFPDDEISCDTLNMSYADDIQPVLQTHCYSCHSNADAPRFGGNIKLEDYGDVKASADDGSLLGSIQHDNNYSPMPRGGGKLNDCTLGKFRSWIADGAANN